MSELEEYQIGESFTVYMRKRDGRYQGHYDNHSSGRRITFDAPGMSRRQILKRLWSKAKEREVQR
jgi:hypothetical protein